MDATRRRTTAYLLAPLTVFLAATFIAGCGGLQTAYEAEVDSARALAPMAVAPVLDDGALAELPAPVRRYIRRCGHVGRPLMPHAEVLWESTDIRTAPDADWMRLRTRQFNAAAEPVRIAYMRTRLFGIVPFEGKDAYLDGTGSMRMVLLKVVTLGDDRGPEMDQSALVTLLAETFLLPAYALAPYMEWEAIDARSARATIRYQGVEASGVFEFDAAGDMVRFRTRDRFYAEGDGRYRRVPWSAELGEHVRDEDGIRWPRTMRGVWHREDGDFVYFRGTLEGIRYSRGP